MKLNKNAPSVGEMFTTVERQPYLQSVMKDAINQLRVGLITQQEAILYLQEDCDTDEEFALQMMVFGKVAI